MELIDNRSKERALKTLRCLPFNLTFYLTTQSKGLKAEVVFRKENEYGNIGSNWFHHPNQVEAAFRWLIQVGVLRREVDGQGLTSKIRLTPLGREILEQNPDLKLQQAGFFEGAVNWLYRNWPFR